MIDYRGAAVLITGAASGIGLAMAMTLRRRGAHVVLVDVDAEALPAAVNEIEQNAAGPAMIALPCDVSSRAAVMEMAAKVRSFGPIRMLCANAGVSGPQDRPAYAHRSDDWAWTMGVNVTGVVNSIDAFLPGMLALEQPCHVVLTASMAGLIPVPGMAPYCASKFAVVGLAETLEAELAGTNVGVSVVCPGYVVSRIHESARHKPDAGVIVGPAQRQAEIGTNLADHVLSGIPADVVAEHVADAVLRNDFYVFTHPTMRRLLDKRYARMVAGMDRAQQNDKLAR